MPRMMVFEGGRHQVVPAREVTVGGHLPGPGRRGGGVHGYRAGTRPREQSLGRRYQPLPGVMASGHSQNDTH